MAGDVTVETKVCCVLQLNNATDTLLLNNVRKMGNSILSGTSRFFLNTT
jgi:hypothetical protein